MEICGAVYDGDQDVWPFVKPVRCNQPAKHSGSHSYNDGNNGVSWSNDPDAETDRQMREGMRRLMAHEFVGSGGAGHNAKSESVSYGGPGTPDFPSVIEYNKLRARERRERIATAAMQGLLAADPNGEWQGNTVAYAACWLADALIAELDKG
ncbi:MAG: hypothetical protein AB7P97_20465 [Hyphomonadaceae bacterium]